MRTFLKRLLYLLAFIVSAPISVPVRLLAPVDREHLVFQAASQFFSLIPGRIGDYLRAGFYAVVIDCAYPPPVVSFGTIFGQRGSRVGARTYIGAQCNLGLCDIGSDVLIGSGVHIASAKMHFHDRLDIPIRLQGGELRRIVVGNDCWIGNRAILMGDVPDGCVVAAGAVLVEAPESHCIYAGVPARKIRRRGPASTDSVA